jgi:hypothetical protein
MNPLQRYVHDRERVGKRLIAFRNFLNRFLHRSRRSFEKQAFDTRVGNAFCNFVGCKSGK